MRSIHASCRSALIALCPLALPSLAVGQGQAGGANGLVSVGQRAVSIVLDHYSLNPIASEPTTGEDVPANGSWSVAKERPPACPATTDTCVKVFYKVPAPPVLCSWVVLLKGDGTDGEFLDQSEDAARYLLRKVTTAEAEPLVVHRQKPVYGAIALAAHVGGVVTLGVTLSPPGAVQRVEVLSGPEILRPSSV